MVKQIISHLKRRQTQTFLLLSSSYQFIFNCQRQSFRHDQMRYDEALNQPRDRCKYECYKCSLMQTINAFTE
jgi:hypothetical protein